MRYRIFSTSACIEITRRSIMPPYRTKERIAASLCSCVCLLQFRTFSSQSINSCMFWRVKWLQFARCLGIAFAVSRKVKNRFRASSYCPEVCSCGTGNLNRYSCHYISTCVPAHKSHAFSSSKCKHCLY